MRSGRCLLATVWLFLSLAAAGTAAAQNPFVGTWKLNQEKSQLAGDTMKFGPAAGDAIELTAGGITYSFRMDGKPYALPSRQCSHLERDQRRWLDHGVSQDRRQADEQGQLEALLRWEKPHRHHQRGEGQRRSVHRHGGVCAHRRHRRADRFLEEHFGQAQLAQ